MKAVLKQLVLLSEDERDRKVRTHVRRNIADYYLMAFPKLREEFKTDKRKRITYAKVQKVKRNRARVPCVADSLLT